MLCLKLLHVSLVICTICLVANGQRLSQPVCKWNQTAQTCQRNETSIIELLGQTGTFFGKMMRCEYATTQQVCENIVNNTCVWAQNSCRVSAPDLVDVIQICIDADAYSFSRYQQCKKDLNERINGLQWVDYGKLSRYFECSKFVTYWQSCRLISKTYNCTDYTTRTNCANNQYQLQARKLSKDIQSLLDRKSSSYIIDIREVERELKIKPGNLQLYESCNLLRKQQCEEWDSIIQELALPSPPPPSPTSPPSPPPPPPQKELEAPLCEWNSKTRDCEKSPRALVDLLASTNNTFAIMMSCSFIDSASECNNELNSACIWDQNYCRIAATYLVEALTDCLYPETNQSVIEVCREQIENVAQGQNWIVIDGTTDANLYGYCKNIQGFSYDEPSCMLLDAALHCDSNYEDLCSRQSRYKRYYGYYSYYSYYRTVEYQLGYPLSSQVNYLMDRNYFNRFDDLYVPDSVYLEKNLNIKSGNLNTYDTCQKRKNQYDCEESILTPSPSPSPSPSYSYSTPSYYSSSYSSRDDDNSSGLSAKAIIGIVMGLIVPCCLCISFGVREQNRQNRINYAQIQATSVGRVQEQARVAQTLQVQMTQNVANGMETAAILANLPTIEYMRQSEGQSAVTCAICMEDLQQGDLSTVLPCGHWYHKNCIEQWTQTRGSNVACPICNLRVADDNTTSSLS